MKMKPETLTSLSYNPMCFKMDLGPYIQDSGKTDKNMEEVNSNGPMEAYTKGIGDKIWQKEKEDLYILMEMYSLEDGNKIKLTGKENIYI